MINTTTFPKSDDFSEINEKIFLFSVSEVFGKSADGEPIEGEGYDSGFLSSDNKEFWLRTLGYRSAAINNAYAWKNYGNNLVVAGIGGASLNFVDSILGYRFGFCI